MDWNYFLAFLGIILTVIFGLLQFRKITHPGGITYAIYETPQIDYWPFSKGRDYAAYYRKIKVGEGLRFYTFALRNTGRTDLALIDPQSFNIQFSNHVRILDSKCVKSSSGISLNIQSKESSAFLLTNHFKVSEMIRVVFIVSFPNRVDSKRTSVEVNSRILNAKSRDVSFEMSYFTPGLSRREKVVTVMAALVAAIALYMWQASYRDRLQIKPYILNEQQVEQPIAPATNAEIVRMRLKDGSWKNVKVSEINDSSDLHIKIEESPLWKFNLIFGVYVVVALSILGASFLWDRRKHKKIRKSFE